MKIVVAVKQVATPDEDLELRSDGRALDPDSLDWDLNEWDSFSLEAARLLRGEDGEVVVVSVGGEEVRDGLLTSLAMGADRSIHVPHDAPEDLDALAVARLLAEVVRREAPDLVLCGVQSADAATAATGVALAALAGLPAVAVVRAIDHDADAGTLTVERELEGGSVERLRLGLPAVLTVQTGINEPRYANLRAIRQATAKPAETIEPSALGLDDDAVRRAAGSRLVRLSVPERSQTAEMLTGSADAIAQQIATIVKSKVG